jgi:hypothetical protein
MSAALIMDPPVRLVRVANVNPEVDVKERTIRSVVMTKTLARDGGIVIPDGIVTKYFEANPTVQALHGEGMSRNSPVIGRSLGLSLIPSGMESVTQFADTELGREYAYLYGVNENGEVYMRAWSFGWRSIERAYWTIDEARTYLGDLWDQEILSVFDQRMNEVWVSVRSEMFEYSAVAVGSDRNALTRAFNDGVRTAGDILQRLDLGEANQILRTLQTRFTGFESRVNKIEKDLQALMRNGSAAALDGDSAGILDELKQIKKEIERS